MKGLIRKDLELIMLQKNFFFIMIGAGLCMSSLALYTMIMFMCYMFGSLMIGTISYDELDNGIPYIMCLPIKRNEYVKEKFLMTFVMIMGGYILGIVASIIIMMIGDNLDILLLLESVILVPLAYVLAVIQIPIRLKYGQEKARLLNIVTMMILMIGSSLLFVSVGGADIQLWMMIAIGVVLIIALIYILYKLSIVIVEKKEY
ncbi:MAG: ABC-2 transporter permease [Erysipelotrichaceae bacterium]